MASAMQKTFMAMISLAGIIVLMQVIPGLGDSINTAMPINQSGAYANVSTGADVYQSVASIVPVVALVSFVGILLGALYMFKRGGGDDE